MSCSSSSDDASGVSVSPTQAVKLLANLGGAEHTKDTVWIDHALGYHDASAESSSVVILNAVTAPTNMQLSAAMFDVVRKNNISAFVELVDAGVKPSWTDEYGRTLLHSCIVNMHPSRHTATMAMLECLLDNGVEVNAQDSEGGTALMYACRKNDNCDAVKLLLKHGATPACIDVTQMTAYMFAAAYNNAPALACMMEECGKHINAADVSGRTALHWATANGCYEAFRQIIRHAVTNVSLVDAECENVLHYLARRNTAVQSYLTVLGDKITYNALAPLFRL